MKYRFDAVERKQLLIFIAVAFGVPYLMGIPMGVNFYRGVDVTAFVNTQMYYPAAGAMLALLLTREKGQKLPVKYYIFFLALTAVMVVSTLFSVFFPDLPMTLISSYITIIGSVIGWIFLLIEKKELRRKCLLSFGDGKEGRGKQTWLWILLFLGVYFLRFFLSSAMGGDLSRFVEMLAGPYVWIGIAFLPVNFFLSYSAFFGEEYGWRGFLQPLLQKRFGLRGGVILLGVVWGLWHLPVNMFYYSPETWLQSVVNQLGTCIGLGIFLGLVMLKTGNIWAVVIMHFLNNNLIAVLSGSMDSVSGNVLSWPNVLASVLMNGVLFGIFILAREFGDRERDLGMIGQEEEAPELKETEYEAQAPEVWPPEE